MGQIPMGGLHGMILSSFLRRKIFFSTDRILTYSLTIPTLIPPIPSLLHLLYQYHDEGTFEPFYDRQTRKIPTSIRTSKHQKSKCKHLASHISSFEKFMDLNSHNIEVTSLELGLESLGVAARIYTSFYGRTRWLSVFT